MTWHTLSRRNFLYTLGGVSSLSLLNCGGNQLWSKGPEMEINPEVLWARRQEWDGPEIVRGICQIDDRYLMVLPAEGIGWRFPGGLVRPKYHGQATKHAMDLLNAVIEYVHNQAMVQVKAKLASIVAYGYGIDEYTQELAMIHWLQVPIPTSTLPLPHANLSNIREAKWVALDDPKLSHCLEQRIEEYSQAKEGGTVLIHNCDTNIVGE